MFLFDLLLTPMHALYVVQSVKAMLHMTGLCHCAGDDQHAPQDILLEARCCLASWLCAAEGIMGPEDVWQARQI